MRRLIEETACDHGKWEDYCGLLVCVQPVVHIHSHKLGCFCPGGSSREVTVNYEAAYRVHFEMCYRDEDMAPVVDAALGGGW